MFALIAENWITFVIAFLIGVATAWWVWARYRGETDTGRIDMPAAEAPKIAAPDPVVAEPKVPVTTAATPAALMDTGKAKAAPKPKAKAPPKAKAEPAKKAAAPKAAAPKAKAEPAKKAAAPKAKAEPAKKAATKPAAKAKVEPVKAKAAPAAKPKVEAKPKAAPAAKPKAAPKPKASPKPAPKPVIPDNLELLKGVGPKLNTLLKSLGVTSFEQVAAWNAADIAEIDSKLGNFAGRISRDNWVDQAKLLSAGDVKTFEKRYGALGSEIG
jgi:predicted flap endonuclease-1-like 5' DNA nuclease